MEAHWFNTTFTAARHLSFAASREISRILWKTIGSKPCSQQPAT